MDGDLKGERSDIQEILHRWRKYLLILLPTVVIALVVGFATENWLVPGILIPLLIAPLAVALLIRNVKVPESRWHLIYRGPLKNAGVVRAELGKLGLQSLDSSEQNMGGRSGSGGQCESDVYVDSTKAEEAYKIVQRFIEENPDVFKEPPARV